MMSGLEKAENLNEKSSIWQRAKSSYLVIFTFILVLALSLRDGESLHVLMAVLRDAYVQVSVFVAFTLVIFYALESKLKLNIKSIIDRYRHYQVPVAALMGAIPGCGGAIIVITQYVRGRLSFGGVVAVLTATMGDAAFLLLAREPVTGVSVMALSVAVGSISGYIIDMIHGQDFLRPNTDIQHEAECFESNGHEGLNLNVADKFWLLLIAPGFVLGILTALQYEGGGTYSQFLMDDFALYFGAIGAGLAVLMWLYASLFRRHKKGEPYGASRNIHMSSEKDHPVHRMIQDTNFVTSWVVLAFFVFEMGVHITNFDLVQMLSGFTMFLPFMAILIGFIPGCGPQVLVTSMYLGGLVPLSAQIGNAISNDGDALFPAIALAPRAAIIATLYSAIPAFVIAYGYMWLFES